MRIVVIMACSSPWSRSTVLQLVELGQTVHVVDFAATESKGEYLGINDEFQKESIRVFKEKIAGLHLIAAPGDSNLKYIACVPQLRSILKSVNPDLVLTLYGGGFATLVHLSLFRPYCVYVVGSDVLLSSGLRRLLSKWSLNSASAVFANGRHLADKTAELATRAKVKPLLLGLNVGKWHLSPQPSGPIRIICTRGFMPVYNNEYIVQALALMPRDLPDFEVVFVSNGPLLDQVRMAADNMLPAVTRCKVKFMGGVDDMALVELLESSHVYVSVSLSDGTSISLLEALSCGLFPVLSDIPQNREWIDPQVNNGFLVPFDAPEKLAEALTGAITDGDARKGAALVNRQLMEIHADSHNNITLLVAEMENIYANR